MARPGDTDKVCEIPQFVFVFPAHDLRDRVGTRDEEELVIRKLSAQITQGIDRISWAVSIDIDPAKPLEVKFVLTVIARADFGSYTDTFAESFNIQIAKLNGAVSTLIATRTVTTPQLGKGVDAGSANPNYRVFRAEFTQVFSAQGTYTATYANNARSSDLANGNKDTDYQVSATVVLDGQRSGPLMAVPPTINLGQAGEGCDLDYCANTARDLSFDYALKNNYGFGGANGALVFKRV